MQYQTHPPKILVSALFLAVMVLSACSSSRHMGHPVVEQKLLQQFERWNGVPYRWGGMSLSGVDCSAFIMMVYSDAFGIQLPRNTAEQMRFGKNANRRNLRVGDVVFFRTGRNTLHSGIVLSGGRMMHASTSRGVEITQLNDPYWIRRFVSARRIL